MSWVTVDEVQQWLETTKMAIESVDPLLATTYKELVFGALANKYTTTGWGEWDDPPTVSTTPTLVRSVIAAFIASTIYQQAYSEDLTGRNWGYTLSQMAQGLLNDLVNGTTLLTDQELSDASVMSMDFYPTDLQEDDESGEERKFTMGRIF